MEELIPGIWHWTARHPEINVEVSSFYLAGARAVLDPMIPGDGLDALAEHPVEQVILTNRLHGRQTADFVEAFGARVRAPRVGLHQFEGRPYEVEPYDFGDELAPGIRSHELGAICPDDGVLHLDYGDGALHFADGLMVRDHVLRFMPDNLMDDPDAVKAKSFERLWELVQLEFDSLLFAHSDPDLAFGKEHLETFLEHHAPEMR